MQSDFSPILALFHPARAVPLAVLVLLGLLAAPAAAQTASVNLLPAGSFSSVRQTYVPWAGVDDQNRIHCIEGSQWMVNDAGKIARAPFGPSVAVADLNGDGKQDLILADTYGYFWYFPNTGTPQAPAFTQGEVIPIWLGEQATEDNHTEALSDVVPRIQLVDFSGTGKLDVVAGTYAGKLFHVPNIGSSAQPNFRPTLALDTLIINTHRRGALWCNYLAPFFTAAFNGGGNVLDLLTGEGTYSANSVWFLHNTDTNDHPTFDEDPEHFKRLVPGMGLEQLAPQVVDWNNDGKPDIITGDRTGCINLFLNNSTDPSKPTFAPGVHVRIAGQEKMGNSITVTVCDLSGNKLPNLLIGRDDGTLLYAVNHGTLGNPQFTTPATPLKGVLPPTYHYTQPTQWRKWGAYGAPYEMLGVTNPQLEPGFAFPEGEKTTYALRFWVWPYKNLYFQRYYPPEENVWNEHVVRGPGLTIKMNTRYRLHFWVMAPQNSVTDFRYNLYDGGRPDQKWVPPNVTGDIQTSSQWTEVTRDFKIDNEPDPTIKQYGYTFEFRFQGQEPFYIDDVQINELKD
ncbi:MAG TPA: hypothetical protein VHY09_02725 [Candidatus Methylacidiphilales bacterium]|jgi:hypothetical protein|nr:hypothetical protein [Candidatus Methylacidiphilales bacterium]